MTVRLGEIYRKVRDALREADLPTPDIDARLLVAEASGIAPQRLVVEAEYEVDAICEGKIARLLSARLARMPVGRILGRRAFWGLDFLLSPETLEPRGDTETLVEAALAAAAAGGELGRPLRIVDLGTGSGAILIALLTELPAAWGVGLDLSPGAVAAARCNAVQNGVGERAAFVCGRWSEALVGDWDLVVSNPPYIDSATIARLDPEVRLHDPVLALDGGADGLDAYRAILPDCDRLLGARDGTALLEIGFDQADAVVRECRAAGFRQVEVVTDLGNHDRVVVATGSNTRQATGDM